MALFLYELRCLSTVEAGGGGGSSRGGGGGLQRMAIEAQRARGRELPGTTANGALLKLTVRTSKTPVRYNAAICWGIYLR
jgi:hypothetical protein